MDVVGRQGRELRYIVVYPDGYEPNKEYPVIFILHGFGANMGDLAELAPAISATGYIFIFPNAPLPIQLDPYTVGFGWTPPREQAIDADRKNADRIVNEFIDEMFAMEQSISPGKAVMLGFSQGGNMTYRCGLGGPRTFAGLVTICAPTPAPAELESNLPPERSQQVFIAYGEFDSDGLQQRAHSAHGVLQKAGYPLVFKGYPMGHTISAQTIADVREWLQTVLPPTT